MIIRDKVAIITGATRGIGREVALIFARHGASLVLSGQNKKLLIELKKELTKGGSKCSIVSGDISSPITSKKLVEKAIDQYNRIDILVNNAGIITRTPSEKMSLDEWDKVIEVNLKGTLFTCLEVIPFMKAQKYGKIINVSSSAAKCPHPNASASYGVSKAGVLYLTRHFALEFASYGIYVNAVCPGPIETDMTKQWDPIYRKKVMSKIPLGRLGKPIEVANVVLFLASGMSDFITGEAININGGTFMD